MSNSKNSSIILFFAIFSILLLVLFFVNFYQKINAPKIILESPNNPLKVTKPNPVNTSMSLEEIVKSLKDLELKNDKSLEVDDIE